MLDLETKSEWSHILGKAMAGPLKGQVLQQIPSVMTDWGTWTKDHPESTVVLLPRTAKEYQRQFYSDPRQFVLGIVSDGEARHWDFATLAKFPVLEEKLGKKETVVFFDSQSITARLFDRKVKNQFLNFTFRDGKIVDKQTFSIWDPTSGRAIEGRLKGESLSPLPAIVSFRAIWRQFHPESK